MDERRGAILQALNEILAEDGKSAGPDENLFEAGIIDSMEMLDLVEKVEDRFHLSLDQSVITVDNFGTLGRLADLIVRKNGKV